MRLTPDCLKERIEHFLLGEDQLVHHGREGNFQIRLPDCFHGAGTDVVQMLLADPDRILQAPGRIDVPLKAAAALTADELAGKGVPSLIAGIILLDVFLPRPLLEQGSGSLEISLADDRLVMIFHIELIPFAAIDMPFKTEV